MNIVQANGSNLGLGWVLGITNKRIGRIARNRTREKRCLSGHVRDSLVPNLGDAAEPVELKSLQEYRSSGRTWFKAYYLAQRTNFAQRRYRKKPTMRSDVNQSCSRLAACPNEVEGWLFITIAKPFSPTKGDVEWL